MERLYQKIIEQHFAENQQMLFMAGPRQVGKTTLAKSVHSLSENFHYFNFDVEHDRNILLRGEEALLNAMSFQQVQAEIPLLVLDEFHKYKHWKNFLKGFYDQYKSQINILVTGSAKLDIFKSGGDSLMGRYLLYHVHPLTVSELLKQPLSESLIHAPKQIDQTQFENLFQLGGYPEPFIKNNSRFSLQWRKLRRQQLFEEDIRNLTQVQDIVQLEMLAQLLREQVGQQINYASLAAAIRVSADTVSRWLNILEKFYYCFRLKPWSKNIKRSLIKEPKVFLWDWAEINDVGARVENFVASHLLKATHYWTDYGLGEFELHYLRDKEKREVDFLISKDNKPWILAEVKSSANHGISKNLYYYQEQLQAPHAFQLVYNLPYVEKDCFDYKKPVIVPLISFLSQLI